jgi:hypothetical protein
LQGKSSSIQSQPSSHGALPFLSAILYQRKNPSNLPLFDATTSSKHPKPVERQDRALTKQNFMHFFSLLKNPSTFFPPGNFAWDQGSLPEQANIFFIINRLGIYFLFVPSLASGLL